MMLRGASLGRRLLVGAGVFIAAALLIAAIVIFFVLHRFVQGQIDQRLDTQILFLSSMLQVECRRHPLARRQRGRTAVRPAAARLVLAGDRPEEHTALPLARRCRSRAARLAAPA